MFSVYELIPASLHQSIRSHYCRHWRRIVERVVWIAPNRVPPLQSQWNYCSRAHPRLQAILKNQFFQYLVHINYDSHKLSLHLFWLHTNSSRNQKYWMRTRTNFLKMDFPSIYFIKIVDFRLTHNCFVR